MAKLKQPNATAPTAAYPAVSVIIPLYNAEKYIAECLDSILAQTFTDFEVIVVDDCSTDSSCAIVESYAERFGGRLILSHMKKNSGGGFGPRNIGLGLSRGEYVYFVDADDFISKTALEVLYSAAKTHDADVVYTGSRYMYTTDGGAELKLDKIARTLKEKNLTDKPTLTVNDPNKNLHSLLIDGGFFWMVPRLVRRNFLAENEIIFREVVINEDFLQMIEILCCAERFLRIPDAVYFWRNDSSKSVTRDKQAVDKQIAKWFDAIVRFEKAFADVVAKREILRDNPAYCYMALKRQFNYCFKRNADERLQVTPEQIFDILRRAFAGKDYSSDLAIPFLLSFIDSQKKTIDTKTQQLSTAQSVSAQAQARIVQLESVIKAQQKNNAANVQKFNQFAAQAQARIAQLEAELKRRP